jgi:hypothetical protein
VNVRFYNGNPFTTGSQIGGNYTVNLPIGGSATVSVTGLPLSAGQELVYVYVDATSNVDEYNENNNTASVNVTNQPPTAKAKDLIVFADAHCEAAVAAAQVNNGSSDPDGDPLTLTLSPAGPFAVGDTQVTLTVSDGKVSSTATATITVIDNTAPEIVCPADIAVNNDAGVCGATVTYTAPVGTDNCPDAMTVQTAGLASGSVFPIGTTVNTFEVTDAAGLKSSCSFSVTVTDAENPVIVCPANKVLVSDSGSCDATGVNLGTPVISDNCPGASIANNHPSTTYPVGVTTVTWTVTDASGNTATCTQTVTVLSSINPSLSGFRPPLAGQPVGNKIRRGQVVPHKLLLKNCSGQTITSGVTVYLKVQGISQLTGLVVEEVAEDAQGVGTDGTLQSDGIMRLTDSQYHFNLDTGNFGDANTIAGDKYYRSTATVVDNATLMVLGTVTVNLETSTR